MDDRKDEKSADNALLHRAGRKIPDDAPGKKGA